MKLPTILAAVAAVTLAACSSPQAPRYHTLMPAIGEVPLAPSVSPLSASWELLPVHMPAQVDQPQFVVRAGDDTMALLEQERWVAPLTSEFKAALAAELSRDLGSGDGVRLPEQQSKKAWRIRVDVQRFDSEPGRYAWIEATWRLSGGESGAASVTCNSIVRNVVAEGYPALSAGHRRAVIEIADQIAATLRQLDTKGSATCAAAPNF